MARNITPMIWIVEIDTQREILPAALPGSDASGQGLTLVDRP